MKKPPYCSKPPGRMWQYRRVVDDELQTIIGKKEIRHSLKTHDIAVARLLAAQQNAEVEVMFAQARARLAQTSTPPPKLPDELPSELRRFIRESVRAQVLADDEENRLARLDDDSLETYESMRGDEFEETGRALRTGRVAWGPDGRKKVAELLQRVGVPVAPGTPQWDMAAYTATEGWNAALRDIRERMRGEAVPTPEPPPVPESLRTAPQPKHDADAARPLTLGAVIDDYLSSVRENDFKRKVNRCLQLLGAMVGRQLPASELRQKAITQFLRDICKLPDKWARRFDKGESVQAMLAEGAQRVMSPTTYEGNYKGPLGTFLTASRRDYGDEGFPSLVVEGIEYSGDRVAEEDQQRALKDEELRTLFEGEEFASVAHDPKQEPLYWFLVVMLFSGARPREVCQTNPQVDFGQLDGEWYMDLDEHSAAGVGIEKTIKTGEARRIPLHPELVRLGFPGYVQRVKDAGADRLFPVWRVKQGNPFTAHYDKVSGLLKAVGLYTREAPPGELVTGAYCLRKTFITQCRNQGVVSKEITGHRDDKTTAIQDRYYIFGPEPFARKVKELGKLQLPVAIPLRAGLESSAS